MIIINPENLFKSIQLSQSNKTENETANSYPDEMSAAEYADKYFGTSSFSIRKFIELSEKEKRRFKGRKNY